MHISQALTTIPQSLREELIIEYRLIVQNYAERRWSPTELSGGRFCEIVYSILDGHAQNSYPHRASKPSDFVGSCKKLEQNKHVPRSFQILIPRLLPALYEVRNNRGVGHVGGDVDPNHMDATFVISNCNWIMAELVRVFHSLSILDAQNLVDSIAERRIPLVWDGADIKRVLNPKIEMTNQVLLLLASSASPVHLKELREWTEYKNITNFTRLIKSMHSRRLLEFSEETGLIEMLPPGSAIVAEMTSKESAL